MANLNLSEFTEKLFVADADHTFIWDSAASISKRVSRNSWLNSGELTSSAPVTISQTWNAGSNVMTALKVVATDTASGATSNLLELWAGSTPALDFAVTKAGVMQVYGTYSSAGANYARLALACDSSGNATISTQALGTGTAGVLAFSPGNSERMRITAAGNVGIGTTAPGAKLQVVGNAIFGENISQPTGSPINVSFGGTYATGVPGTKANLKWDLYRDASGDSSRTGIGISAGLMEFQGGSGAGFGFYPNNSTTSALHIISSGNVGIGTTAPGSKLSVVGNMAVRNTAGAPGTGIGIEFDTDISIPRFSFVFNNVYASIITQTVDTLGLKTLTGTTIAFGGNSDANQVVLKTATGNLGIGTTSPSSKLQVTNGDVEIETVTSGIIMKAAGTANRYRITLNAGGTDFVITAL